MNFNAVIRKLCLLFLCSGILYQGFALSGKVVDTTGAGIEGATVKLVVAKDSTVTDSDGKWEISMSGTINPLLKKSLLPKPIFKGNTLHFIVDRNNSDVKVGIFSLNGKFLYNALDQKLSAGLYRLNPVNRPLKANTYAIQLRIGDETYCLKLPLANGIKMSSSISSYTSINSTSSESQKKLEKRTVVVDTVKVSKDGYTSASSTVNSYDDTVNITLKAYSPSYYLNPPNPCYNKFYVDSCTPGDPNSACGGNCRVANSCSPPEDASKADLPKTFICPKFMLFSSDMLQAAKDDARLYGWDEDNPPFNYGVVGHDPDVGGLDDVESSCCQCYQIVYNTPEASSPQPPDLPYPKPLIVQSFNTAASGPKGFDVFMGAGGYGAFNSCYKDAAFSTTTKFNEFIYDGFPYQNPGSGGISFLRCPECIQGWPVTVEGVESEACQKKIKELCDQALVNSSDQVTEDTRRSCIESNKIASLYHQNWNVYAKRVRCPMNLTRVTGCRLKEEKLPLPSPEVKTPSDAKSNGTFSDGYHTTTMQDCCKPTCAWTDWVVKYKLPADGPWNSFYSCDKNGKPITE